MGFRRKTRAGRLRELDKLLPQLAPEAFVPGPLPILDLGIGAQPWTTLELADRVAPVPVVGIDHAEAVVQRARRDAVPGVTFLVGGLDLPLVGRLVRVMNVLRDLDGPGAVDAHRRLTAGVVEGGLVIEGSCGPSGEVGVVHLLRRSGDRLRREAVVFWVDGSRGDAPLALRDRLPRDLACDRSHPVWELLQAWMAAYRATAPGPTRLASAATRCGIEGLDALGPRAVLWRPTGGVPPTVHQRGAL